MSGDFLDPSRGGRALSDAKDLYLDQLDQQKPGSSQAAERRRHERHTHRVNEGLEVIFDAFDGQPVTCRVRPRNLSQGGIAFLHEAYVYPETRCTVVLVSVTDQPIEVSGKVVGCRHIAGKLHEVAMSFDRTIEPDDFLECVQEALPGTES